MPKNKCWFTEKELRKNRVPLKLSNEEKLKWKEWFKRDRAECVMAWKGMVGLK